MDTHATVGIIGTMASYGLEAYHAVAATAAAVATLVYMLVSIYFKLRNKK